MMFNDVVDLKAINMQTLTQTTTADCTDENSQFLSSDDQFHHHIPMIIMNSNYEPKDDDYIHHHFLSPIDECVTKKYYVKKLDANFDRLTCDIQFALNEAKIHCQ